MDGPDDAPQFPLTLTSHAHGDAWTFEDSSDLVASLPEFDGDDPSQAASVVDGRGRMVRLVIRNGRIVLLTLAPGWPSFDFS